MLGATVVRTNMGQAPQEANAKDGSLDTRFLGNRESASGRFDEPGTFLYECMLRATLMQATAIVM